MIISGGIVNGGEWEKVSDREKKHLREKVCIVLSVMGVQAPERYFRKINDDIVLAFSDAKMERRCRGIDWGILYPTDYFEKYILIGNDNSFNPPPYFCLKPDFHYYDFQEIFEFSESTVIAIYQNKYFYDIKFTRESMLIMVSVFQKRWKII